MITFPNAKINLGLNIVSKRSDGYHNLETIFYPIGIKDALEINVRETETIDRFIEAGINVNATPDNNLVMKALRLMRTHYTIPTLEIHLLKKIPFGSGIGGGSADASFMLKLLNQTFMLGASDKQLADLARNIGADCPFFIYNKPLFAKGIGEKFEPVNVSLKGYHLVLIKPTINVSTKEAFSLIKPKEPQQSLKETITHPIEKWKDSIHNDFEDSIFPQYPLIAQIKQQLYDLGAIYASMSGSGSSIYGIFNNEIESEQFANHYVWQGLMT